MGSRFNVSQGDELEIRPNEKIGWVTGVVSYADKSGVSFIVDTKDHGRFSFADSAHEDIRKKGSR